MEFEYTHSGIFVLVGNGNYIVIMDNCYPDRRLLPFDNLSISWVMFCPKAIMLQQQQSITDNSVLSCSF